VAANGGVENCQGKSQENGGVENPSTEAFHRCAAIKLKGKRSICIK